MTTWRTGNRHRKRVARRKEAARIQHEFDEWIAGRRPYFRGVARIQKGASFDEHTRWPRITPEQLRQVGEACQKAGKAIQEFGYTVTGFFERFADRVRFNRAKSVTARTEEDHLGEQTRNDAADALRYLYLDRPLTEKERDIAERYRQELEKRCTPIFLGGDYEIKRLDEFGVYEEKLKIEDLIDTEPKPEDTIEWEIEWPKSAGPIIEGTIGTSFEIDGQEYGPEYVNGATFSVGSIDGDTPLTGDAEIYIFDERTSEIDGDRQASPDKADGDIARDESGDGSEAGTGQGTVDDNGLETPDRGGE